MAKITLIDSVASVQVGLDVPVVPRRGDYIVHDPSGASGEVTQVRFIWREGAAEPTIVVEVK